MRLHTRRFEGITGSDVTRLKYVSSASQVEGPTSSARPSYTMIHSLTSRVSSASQGRLKWKTLRHQRPSVPSHGRSSTPFR